MTFLLVGTDRRPWGTETNELDRADSIMLAHLPADRSVAYLISIPRRGRVMLGRQPQDLRGVFAVGGVTALRESVRRLTGIVVDGAVEVDFAGLIAVTDAVGGIELCVPRKAVSEHTGRVFQPGCRRFSGEEAMDYLRQRKSFEDGDFDRQKHGRQYVKALYERLGEASLPQLLQVIDAGGKAIRVDAGVELAAVFAAARDVKTGEVVSIETPATFDGIKPEAARLWTAVRDGTLQQWVLANPQQVG